MKRTVSVVTLVLLVAACGALEAQVVFRVDAGVATTLAEMSDTASVEVAVCFAGKQEGDTISLREITAASVGEREGVNLDCPVGSLAHWHTHVVSFVRELFHNPDLQTSDACYLSRTDQGTKTPLLIVQAGRTVCWWRQDQLPAPSRLFFFPPEGQLDTLMLRSR